MQVVLLAAFARVLAELDTVEEAVIQQCLHIIVRLVQAYRGLWPKQRLPVHAALNILLSALRPKQAVLQSMLPRLVSVLLTHTLQPADDNLVAGEACQPYSEPPHACLGRLAASSCCRLKGSCYDASCCRCFLSPQCCYALQASHVQEPTAAVLKVVACCLTRAVKTYGQKS